MKKITLLALLGLSIQITNAQSTCASALPITAGTHVVDVVNGNEVPTPICADNGTGATAGKWYTYTPTQNYSLTITSDLQINSGKDTRFHVYTGTCGSLTCHAGDDDGGVIGNGYLSVDTFTVMAGPTYSIASEHKWKGSGF